VRINRTKQLLREGKVALGVIQGQLRSPEIPRMFAAAGLDWIFLDCEHGCFTIETVQDLIRSALLTPITPIVRVADLQYDLVARALDMGAEGIILPRIESPELLAKAVSWARFPPLGIRGFGLTPVSAGYTTASIPEIIAHCNEQVLVVAQIESQTALDRCEELASVPGVDVLLVGPADLSISLGVGGDWDNPKLIAAVERVIDVCQRYNRWPSLQVRNAALAKHWMQRGIKLVGCSNEQMLLWGAIKAMTDDLRPA
jgi:2-dehydro-3-deoxyglucarate aldolase/4-hydroxy-2-oxoheptanedioate aldolase